MKKTLLSENSRRECFLWLCTDFAFPIAFENVFARLIVKICIVVGDGIINPRGVNLYQDIDKMVCVITGNIFNQSFVHLADGPIVWDIVTAGGYIVKRTNIKWKLKNDCCKKKRDFRHTFLVWCKSDFYSTDDYESDIPGTIWFSGEILLPNRSWFILSQLFYKVIDGRGTGDVFNIKGKKSPFVDASIQSPRSVGRRF